MNNGIKTGSDRQPRGAVRSFSAAAAVSTVMGEALQSNLMSLFVHRIGFTSVLIGTLYMAVRAVT